MCAEPAGAQGRATRETPTGVSTSLGRSEPTNASAEPQKDLAGGDSDCGAGFRGQGGSPVTRDAGPTSEIGP